MALSANISARVLATDTDAAPTVDLGTGTGAEALTDQSVGVVLTDGTGAGEADLVFSDSRNLTASSNEDLDLAGVLTDAFGATLTYVRVKSIYVAAWAANTNDVIVGAAASNQWATLLNTTGTVTLPPGASMLVTAGVADATAWAVTAGTGDLLRVENSAGGTAVDYDIVVVGASA